MTASVPSRSATASAGAVGQLALGLDADRDHDAGRRRAQRVEVVLVMRAGDDVLPEQRIVARAVVLGRQPEVGRVGPGLSAKSAGIGPLRLVSAMNFAIAGPMPSRS